MVVVKTMWPPPAKFPIGVRAPSEVRTGRASQPVSLTILAMLAWLLLAPVWFTLNARAQSPGASQYDVEAVYLYNFAKFVRWPPGSPGSTVQICVAAQRVFVDALTRVVAGERIETRPLTVRVIQRPEDEAACDMLFIDASAKERLGSLLSAASGKPILTVSDIPGFLDGGGMIQLLLMDNRVRFSVDLRPVARSEIALSSEFLKVAVTVRGQSAGGGTQ